MISSLFALLPALVVTLTSPAIQVSPPDMAPRAAAVSHSVCARGAYVAFSASAIVVPGAHQSRPRFNFMVDYVHRYNPKIDPAPVVWAILHACYDGDCDPIWMMVYARRESTFNVADRNRSTGCMGLMQIHPCHRKSMKAMGLDFDSEHDRLLFACYLKHAQGNRPWAVRSAAEPEYRKLVGGVK